jgi:hypothetical protein
MREPAFVLEDEPRAPAAGVFFTRGHPVRVHCAIAASLRSRAWRTGRCTDHCNARSRYQTWPGWNCTPVSRVIIVAIRGNVHRSVAKPWAGAPCSNARSTRVSAARSKRGLRPARPAAFKPGRP